MILKPARDLLDKTYIKDKSINININGKIIVGEGNPDDDQTGIRDSTQRSSFINTANDNLQGTIKNDLILGESGNDTIEGQAGDDVLYGGDGRDQLSGGAGADHLFGGAGNDILDGGLGNDVLDGGAGDDLYIIDSGDGDDIIDDADKRGKIVWNGVAVSGGSREQDLGGTYTGAYTSIAGNTIYTKQGADLVITHSILAGSLTLKGFTDGDYGIRLIDAAANSAIVNGTPGHDSAVYYPQTQHPNAAAGFLVAGGESGPSTSGAGLLSAQQDTKNINGGLGYDTIEGNGVTGVILNGGADGDLINADSNGVRRSILTQQGEPGWLPLPSPGEGARLFGDVGHDIVWGGLRDDFIDGGNGGDWAKGYTGQDTIYGGLGNDLLDGGRDDDALYGDGGNDRILGAAGNDYLVGGDNDDQIWGDTTISAIARWSGVGTGNTDSKITVTAGITTPSIRYVLKDVALNQAGADVLNGGAGKDFLYGGAGDDILYGGTGNDELQGEAGDDILFGGAGGDKLFGDKDPQSFLIDTNQIWTVAGLNTYFWRQHQDGSNVAGNDYLDGGAGNDELTGGRGEDILIGGSGDDKLVGGAGNDIYQFSLGDGQDTISDASGTNLIRFGSGITPADVAIEIDISGVTNAAVVSYGSVLLGGQITIENGFFTDQKYQFADGGVLDLRAMLGSGRLRFTGLNDTFNLINSGDVDADANGGAGDDQIFTGAGNDIITGNAGYDELAGGAGDDAYVFNLGDGEDTLVDTAGIDTARFGAGITPDDVWFSVKYQYGNRHALLMTYGNNGDSVEIASGLNAVVDRFEFSDGQNFTLDELLARNLPSPITLPPPGSPIPNDLPIIPGEPGLNLFGGAGFDGFQLIGDDGNDDLQSGDDGLRYTLIGGKGNDVLRGDFAEVHYVFNLGDGQDSILGSTDSTDIIVFGPGIDRSSVTFEASSNFQFEGPAGFRSYPGLKISYGNQNDAIFVWKGNDALHRIEELRFSDGSRITDYTPTVVAGDTQVGTIASLEAAGILTPGGEPDTYNGFNADLGGMVQYGNEYNNNFFGTAGNDTLYGSDGDDVLTGNAGNDFLYGEWENDTLLGGAGNDFLDGGYNDDVLSGGAGNDILYDFRGVNTFNGGTGDDTFVGGNSNDTYIYNPGDGIDRIRDMGGFDTLQFGVGIDANALSLGLGSLLIRPGNSGDAIHIEGFNPLDVLGSQSIDSFSFADGTSLSYAQLVERGFDIDGTSGDDVLSGTNLTDRINGLDGNDTLTGGSGNDVLNGGAGDDTYIINAGDGSDTIIDTAGNDRVVLNGAASINDLSANRQVNDLVIQLTNNLIYLQDWFLGQTIETFELSDGSTLTAQQVQALANTAPVLSNPMTDVVVDEDIPLNLALPVNTFTDADVGDSLSYVATLADGADLPTWLNFDAVNQIFNGTPLNDDVASFDVKVTATDGEGESASDSFNLTVNNTNDVPVAINSITNLETEQEQPFSFTLPNNIFDDVDIQHGDTLSLNATLADGSALPGWLNFNANTGEFFGTPGFDDVYDLNIKLTATDVAGESAFQDFTLIIHREPGQTFLGSNKADTLIGRNGGDTMLGFKGNDFIDGGRGDDTIFGGKGNDTLIGGEDNDTIFGGKGKDTLIGGVGDDTLNGGKGKDTLDGGDGNDTLIATGKKNTLIGGPGDDTLQLGQGHNDIRFNQGDGLDTLVARYFKTDNDDNHHEPEARFSHGNEISFGDGITYDRLWFSRDGDSLNIQILGSSDGMNIQDWYTRPGQDDHPKDFIVEEFKTSNGAELEARQVELLVQAMASFNPTPAGDLTLTPEQQDQLNTTLASAWEAGH